MSALALSSSQDGQRTVLRAQGVSKAYGSTQALDQVDLALGRGEIHALLGGNGSGKSTLIRILAGVETGDSGVITFGSTEVPASRVTPRTAREAGLHVVHQSSSVFPDLSVAENIALGSRYPMRGGKISWNRLNQHAERVLRRFEIAALPETRVDALSPAVQMTVAIARALQDAESNSDSILILDEPTAALPAHEVEILLSALRRYAQRGQAIVIVTHRIDEVLRIADRITVFRDGHLITTMYNDALTQKEIVEYILGRPEDEVFQRVPTDSDAPVALEVKNLSVPPVSGVHLSVRRGEVVGLAGLLGSGRSETLQALFGALPSQGEIVLDGKELELKDPQDAMAAGIAYVPEDRAIAAAFLDLAVGINTTIATLDRYWRGMRLHKRQERQDVLDAISTAGVVTAGPDVPISALSGGNQQKVIMARWLRRNPRVLLLDEPTQGVDVGARADIHAQVRACARSGACAILVSSDFEELAQVCDRVLVLGGGGVREEVTGDRLNSRDLTSLVQQVQ